MKKSCSSYKTTIYRKSKQTEETNFKSKQNMQFNFLKNDKQKHTQIFDQHTIESLQNSMPTYST